MRIAIHTHTTHEHPHLHHHILWAVLAIIVFLFLFSRGVAGKTVTATDGLTGVSYFERVLRNATTSCSPARVA